MAHESGKPLAHYRLTEKLGEGGMGVVWRAADSTLGRDVAIKILPDRFAADPERMARFEREARLLASLQHANIAAIYGLHSADGVRFLAMELVEGEDLAARIARGPLPTREVLSIARQIAEALEAAHEKGILHRDLKPANVKLGPDGQVKLLDFGLAKALEVGPASGSAPNLSQSPTITAMMTQADVILGTAAYMSPEQARGRAVDRRADIWSFGVVVFEMLTGRQLFQGETVSDTLAAVLKTDPVWSDLPRETPRLLVDLIHRCLERDARQRLRDIGEARIVLERLERSGGTEPDPAPVASPRRGLNPFVYAALGLALGAGATFMLPRDDSRSPDVPLRRFVLPTPNDRRPTEIEIAPDGSAVIYDLADSLWVQELNHLGPRLLATEPGLGGLFWSPDAHFAGYLVGSRVVKVSVTSGERQVVSDTRESFTGGSGASWSEDGTIVLSHAESTGLLRVDAVGGDAQVILSPDTTRESDFHDPHVLPGGRGILFVPHEKSGLGTICVLAGDRRKNVIQLPGSTISTPAYSSSGHVIFGRAGDNPGIWALPFSLDRLQATGEPFLITADGRLPTVSREGTLMYVGGGSSTIQFVWADGEGRTIGAVGPVIAEGRPFCSTSADGRRIALVASEQDNTDLWVVDAQRGARTRLTFDPGEVAWPAWSPDGGRIVYQAGARNCASVDCFSIILGPADGTGVGDTLARGAVIPTLTPDGRHVLFSSNSTSIDLFYASITGDRTPQSLDQSQGYQVDGRVAPNGRYVAYASNESGEWEVYLRRFPSGDGKWQVSVRGGAHPRWNGRGDRIYYANGDELMEVGLEGGDVPILSAPRLLFAREPFSISLPIGLPAEFDVTADGSRFLLIRDAGSRDRMGITVVQNWPAEFAGK